MTVKCAFESCEQSNQKTLVKQFDKILNLNRMGFGTIEVEGKGVCNEHFMLVAALHMDEIPELADRNIRLFIDEAFLERARGLRRLLRRAERANGSE
jgi:hypothetical protein